MKYFYTILILTFLLPSLGQTAARSKYFALYAQYNSYDDLVNNSSNEKKELSSDYSLNLDIRLIRIFILTLHGGQSFDGERSFSGLGFKVDLPGFFLFGGDINDLIRRKKRKGINTSIHWKTYIIRDANQGDRYVGNKISLSADIKFTESMFMNLDLGLYSHKGDQFLSPTLGVGFEF